MRRVVLILAIMALSVLLFPAFNTVARASDVNNYQSLYIPTGCLKKKGGSYISILR